MDDNLRMVIEPEIDDSNMVKDIQITMTKSGKIIERELGDSLKRADEQMAKFAKLQKDVLSGNAPSGFSKRMYATEKSIASAASKLISLYDISVKLSHQQDPTKGQTEEYTRLTEQLEKAKQVYASVDASAKSRHPLAKTWKEELQEIKNLYLELDMIERKRATHMAKKGFGPNDTDSYLKGLDTREQKLFDMLGEYRGREERLMDVFGIKDKNVDKLLGADPAQIDAYFDRIAEDAKRAKQVVEELQAKLAEMPQYNETGVVDDGQLDRLQEAASEFQILSDNGEDLEESMKGASGATMTLTSRMYLLQRMGREIANGIKRDFKLLGKVIATSLSPAILAFKRLKSAGENMFGSHTIGWKKLLGVVLRYGFGVRSLFFLFRRLRKYVAEAFKVMAQEIPEVNTAISSMLTAANGLKASLGTLFQPLLTNGLATLAVNIMEKLKATIESVAMVIAQLMGQDYIYVATASWVNYADAVKDANKQLAGFDKLNNLSSQKATTGLDPSNIQYKKVPIKANEWVKDWIEKLKKAYQDADFTDVGREIALGLAKALNKIDWDAVKKHANRFSKMLATFINGLVSAPELATAIGHTLAQLINTAFEMLNTFATTVHWSEIGVFLLLGVRKFLNEWDAKLTGVSIANLANGIIDLLYAFVSDKKNWSLLGIKICEGIKSFLETFDFKKAGKTVQNTIDGIYTFFKTIFGDTAMWQQIGESIGEFFNGINWKTTWFELKDLAKTIFNALKIAIEAQYRKNPESISIPLKLTAAILGFNVAKVAAKTLLRMALAKALGGAFAAGAGIGGSAGGVGLGTLTLSIALSLVVFKINWAIGDGIVNAANTIGKKIKSLIEDAIVDSSDSQSGSGGRGKDGWFVRWFKETFKSDGPTVESLITNQYKNLGKYAKDGYNEGIKDLPSDVAGIITDSVKAAAEAQDSHSPSKEFKKLGVYGKEGYLEGFKDIVTEVVTKIKELIQGTNEQFGISGKISSVFENIGFNIKDSFIGSLSDLEYNWTDVWYGLVTAMKSPINGIIGMINSILLAAQQLQNNLADMFNAFHLEIPDWVPLFGGKELSFNVGKWTAPQIPYLAKGAVIPPNAPFMAMLGDQRNGTNIEAPLETIKQAVAEVLQTVDVNVVFDVEGDPENIFKVVQKRARAYSDRTGEPAFD